MFNANEQEIKNCRQTVAWIVRQWHNHVDFCTPLTLKKLYENLYGQDNFLDDDNNEQKSDDHICMTVEWAGSGKVLSYGFMVLKAEPLLNLPHLLGALLPPNPHYCSHLHRVFLGHEGKELTSAPGLLDIERGKTCGDVLTEEAVLVIAPGGRFCTK